MTRRSKQICNSQIQCQTLNKFVIGPWVRSRLSLSVLSLTSERTYQFVGWFCSLTARHLPNPHLQIWIFKHVASADWRGLEKLCIVVEVVQDKKGCVRIRYRIVVGDKFVQSQAWKTMFCNEYVLEVSQAIITIPLKLATCAGARVNPLSYFQYLQNYCRLIWCCGSNNKLVALFALYLDESQEQLRFALFAANLLW